MGNVVFATQALLTGAALTSGPFAAAAPPSNLLRREPSDALILTDLAQSYIMVDMGSPQALRLIAALYVSATAGIATWRVRAASSIDALTTAPGYDSGSIAFGRGEAGLRHRRSRLHDWLWVPAAPSYRYWRIDFTDPTNADGRLIVGNLVMDYGWQPERNFVYGWSIGLIDPSRKPKAAAGQVEPLNRRPYMGGEFSIEFGSEADMYGSAWDLDEICGTTTPALLLRDPDLTQYRQKQSLFGLFSDLSPIVNPHHRLYSKRWRIEELIP